MKWLERLMLAVGFATMGYLFWRLDAGAIWANVMKIGAGMALIISQQIVDHLINAWGWKFSFSEKDAEGLSYWKLVKIRIAGDGVNYLTPSATIAGELVRPAMLGNGVSQEAKIASVVIARFTQSLGQALFIMLGLMIVANARIARIDSLPLMRFIHDWFFIPVTVFLGTLTAFAVYALKTWGGRGANASKVPVLGRWSAVRTEISAYFLEHPGRFAVSSFLFMTSYFWGCVEMFLICHFMGIGAAPLVVLTLEVLSSIFDGLMFMVPAKIGTQEAGKTAIFTGLGFPPYQGFALGLIRHMRELLWASAGFLIYAFHRRAHPAQFGGKKPDRATADRAF